MYELQREREREREREVLKAEPDEISQQEGIRACADMRCPAPPALPRPEGLGWGGTVPKAHRRMPTPRTKVRASSVTFVAIRDDDDTTKK